MPFILVCRTAKRIFTPFLLAMALTAAGSAAAGEEKNFTGLYEAAIAHFNEGEMQSAMIQAQNALQLNPNHLPSRILLGKIYLQTGRGSAAEKELTIALSLGAARDQLYLPLGNAYLLQRKYQTILDKIDIVGTRPKVRAELLTLHGRAHFQLGQVVEAEQAFQAAMRLDSRAVGPLLGQAALLRSQGKLDEAEALIEKARDLSPSHSEVWYEKGEILTARDASQSALTAYSRALELAPGHMRARLARALLYLQLNDNEKARQDAQLARQMQPLDPEAALLLAQALGKLGKKEAAQAALQSAENILDRISPAVLMHQPGLLKTAASIYLLRGDARQADAYLSRYIVLNPLDSDVRKLLAQIKLHLNEPGAVEAVLYRAHRVRPNDPEILYLLGEAYLQTGRYVLASNMLEKAAQLAPSAPAIETRLALGKLGIGRTEAAIAALEKAYAAGGHHSVSAGIMLTIISIKRGEHETALATASTLKARDPDNPLLANLIGVVYLSMPQTGAAREAFEQALRLDPSFFPASYNLAMIEVKRGQLEAAQSRYRAILDAQPEAFQALLGMAEIATRQAHTEAAVSWLIKASQAQPDNIEPRVKLIKLYLASNRQEKAHLEAGVLKQKHPENPDALEIYAVTQRAMGLNDQAIATYRTAAKYAGFSAQALLRIGRDQVRLNDYEGAILTLEKAAATHLSGRANALLVDLKLKRGDTAGARFSANKVLAEQPDLPAGYNLRGAIALFEKKPAAALAHYQAGFEKQHNSRSLMGVYRSYTLLGEKKKAFEVLRGWLEKSPGDNFVRRNLALGYLADGNSEAAKAEFEYLASSGDRGAVVMTSLARLYQMESDPRARDYGLQALKRNPNWPAALDTYGWILVTEGEPGKGLRYLREAVSRDSNLLMRYHLAVALSQLGRNEEAKAELETIFRANQDHHWIANARELYRSLKES